MTDQLFDPDRERDAEQAPVSDELLPDPGFDSAFFDAPSEEEKSAATGSMTRDTLFPADPIFFSQTEEQTSDTASEQDSSVEAEPDPVSSEEGGEDSLESLFSGALFDPAPMHADSSEEGSVLFHVPESAREDGMTTAAFYAASELREDTPETASVPEEGAASSSADSKRTE